MLTLNVAASTSDGFPSKRIICLFADLNGLENKELIKNGELFLGAKAKGPTFSCSV